MRGVTVLPTCRRKTQVACPSATIFSGGTETWRLRTWPAKLLTANADTMKINGWWRGDLASITKHANNASLA